MSKNNESKVNIMDELYKHCHNSNFEFIPLIEELGLYRCKNCNQLIIVKSFDLTEIGNIIEKLLYEMINRNERSKIMKMKQIAGIELAKTKGVKFGKSPKQIPENFEEVYEKWKNKEFGSRVAGKLLGVSHDTFLKWVKKKEGGEI